MDASLLERLSLPTLRYLCARPVPASVQQCPWTDSSARGQKPIMSVLLSDQLHRLRSTPRQQCQWTDSHALDNDNARGQPWPWTDSSPVDRQSCPWTEADNVRPTVRSAPPSKVATSMWTAVPLDREPWPWTDSSSSGLQPWPWTYSSARGQTPAMSVLLSDSATC